jgi:hypothetical protein
MNSHKDSQYETLYLMNKNFVNPELWEQKSAVMRITMHIDRSPAVVGRVMSARTPHAPLLLSTSLHHSSSPRYLISV